jgi:bcr-type benzoyl-CoA reductase subunit C
MLGETADISLADLHLPNFACSFVRSSLEAGLKGKYRFLDGMVFSQSCDSVQVLSNIWRKHFAHKFNASMVSPTKMDAAGSLYYFIDELNRFKKEMENFLGRVITDRDINKSIRTYNKNRKLLKDLYALRKDACDLTARDLLYVLISGMLITKEEHTELLENLIGHLRCRPPQTSNNPRIILTGNIYSSYEISAMIEETGMSVVDDDLCIGSRYFLGSIDEEMEPLAAIAQRYLRKVHCPCKHRTDFDRGEYLLRLAREGKAQAVIFMQVKFCDSHLFDYAHIRKKLQNNGVQHLLIEYDMQSMSLEQIKTRLEAFCEILRKEDRSPDSVGKKKYFVGIDVGSISSEVVIINQKKEIVSYAIAATGAHSDVAIQEALDRALRKSNIGEEDIHSIISTGYGRKNVKNKDKSITEISCHCSGANLLFPNTRTIIDVGGQDSKVIKSDGKGNVTNFKMNDKCAAGTGRFLEVMARALEIELDDFGDVANRGRNRLNLSSICTVFAESEVISLLAQGEGVEDIAIGICNAIARRIMPMIQSIGPEQELTITGGVAKNKGVVTALENVLNTKINTPEEPQIVGALGAALKGIDEYESAKN